MDNKIPSRNRGISIFHKLLNLFYRVVAPNNPRGWIQVFIEEDRENKGKKHVFTDGMQKWNFPNIEFSSVPDDLSGRVHGLIFEIIGYLKNSKVIKPDETFGLQTEYLTIAGKIIDGNQNRLKVVDLDYSESTGEDDFPKKMLHTVLVTEVLASNSTMPVDEEIKLLQRAISLFEGDPKRPILKESDLNDNFHQNGATAFQLIADAYAEKGDTEDCIKALDRFCKLSPYDMKLYGSKIVEAIKSNRLNPEDIRSKYWMEKEAKGELR